VLLITGLVAGLAASACSPTSVGAAGGASAAGQAGGNRATATATPHVSRVTAPPAGRIPFPEFSYATCRGPQFADGSCLLPRQLAPTQRTRDRYASIHDEMTGLLSLCATAGFDNCARAGRHYLGASGTPITVSVARLYQDVPGFQELLQSWLQTRVASALRGLRGTPPDRSASATWDSGGAAREWGSFDAAGDSGDWHYTLGRFWARMTGDVWIGPAGPGGDRPVRIRYRSFVWDIYNFNAGSLFQDLEDLAKAGIAADFLITGASKTEVINTSLSVLGPVRSSRAAPEHRSRE
jgi:hypothetical protein